MNNDRYQKICADYYTLSLKKEPNPEDELRLLGILEIAAEDSHLCSLIAEIDERIFEETDELLEPSEQKIKAEISNIKEKLGLSSFEDEVEGKTSIFQDEDGVIPEILLEYINFNAALDRPSSVFSVFNKLFIANSVSDPKISNLVAGLAEQENSLKAFSVTLYHCLYLPINKWLLNPEYHLLITRLIDMFDLREVAKSRKTIKPELFDALLSFSQTEYHATLSRLANCIRHKVYSQSPDVGVLREPVNFPHAISCIEEKKTISISVKSLLSQAKLNAQKFCQKHFTGRVASPSVQQCVVVSPIFPGKPGRVRFQGVFWQARLHDSKLSIGLHVNQRVNVVGRDGLTQLVAPYEPCAEAPMEPLPNPLAAIVESPICPGSLGRIKVQGILWPAKIHHGFASGRMLPGQEVQFVGRIGNTAVVRPNLPSTKKPIPTSPETIPLARSIYVS